MLSTRKPLPPWAKLGPKPTFSSASLPSKLVSGDVMQWMRASLSLSQLHFPQGQWLKADSVCAKGDPAEANLAKWAVFFGVGPPVLVAFKEHQKDPP